MVREDIWTLQEIIRKLILHRFFNVQSSVLVEEAEKCSYIIQLKFHSATSGTHIIRLYIPLLLEVLDIYLFVCLFVCC